jgi:ABC-2 type transport system ATP-binding protein
MTVLELSGVTKTHGRVTALDKVDLEVEAGELVALLGPNGAGKTTMFELLLGLSSPTEGGIRVLGGAPGSRGIVGRIGAMLQGAGLPENITVHDLVRLIGRSYPLSLPVELVLERVGLTARRNRTVTDLSGGERQRLLLAAAIVGVPDLLLLDEPTAAMDPEGKRGFWREARTAVGDGTTVVFATHDLAEADSVAQRVVVLGQGRILADGTPSELKSVIHGKTVRLQTDVPIAELAALPGSGPVEVEGPGTTPDHQWVRVHSEAPEELVAALLARGIPVEGLTIVDAELEDAFLKLTDAKAMKGDAA